MKIGPGRWLTVGVEGTRAEDQAGSPPGGAGGRGEADKVGLARGWQDHALRVSGRSVML